MKQVNYIELLHIYNKMPEDSFLKTVGSLAMDKLKKAYPSSPTVNTTQIVENINKPKPTLEQEEAAMRKAISSVSDGLWNVAYKATEPINVSGMGETFLGALASPFVKMNEAAKSSLRNTMNSFTYYNQQMNEAKGFEKATPIYEMAKTGVFTIPSMVIEGIAGVHPASKESVAWSFEKLGEGFKWIDEKRKKAHEIHYNARVKMLSQPGYYLDPANPDYEERMKKTEDNHETSKTINYIASDFILNVAAIWAMGKGGKRIKKQFELKANEVRATDLPTQMKDVVLGFLLPL